MPGSRGTSQETNAYVFCFFSSPTAQNAVICSVAIHLINLSSLSEARLTLTGLLMEGVIGYFSASTVVDEVQTSQRQWHLREILSRLLGVLICLRRRKLVPQAFYLRLQRIDLLLLGIEPGFA
jgi:hypothetical protein